MKTDNADPRQREIDALRERLSGLIAAVLRVSASLDLDTVLQEVVGSARALTGARYGMITTVDDAGRVADFVTSGFTPEQQARLADLPSHVRALGFSADRLPCRTLHGASMRHRGVHIGNFFLGDKQADGQFSAADDELLALFASQAAAAIAHARAHRDERRARARLEALIETSPVGVVGC